jgi:hypothetical protein
MALKARRLFRPKITEISGVDSPAHLAPGWLVKKQAGEAGDEELVRRIVAKVEEEEHRDVAVLVQALDGAGNDSAAQVLDALAPIFADAPRNVKGALDTLTAWLGEDDDVADEKPTKKQQEQTMSSTLRWGRVTKSAVWDRMTAEAAEFQKAAAARGQQLTREQAMVEVGRIKPELVEEYQAAPDPEPVEDVEKVVPLPGHAEFERLDAYVESIAKAKGITRDAAIRAAMATPEGQALRAAHNAAAGF